jgi:hypothetical protein
VFEAPPHESGNRCELEAWAERTWWSQPQPPTPATVRALCQDLAPSTRLTFRAGALVRQARWLANEHRLQLQCAIVTPASPIAEIQRHWLRRLAIQCSDEFRLLDVHLLRDHRLLARVDLTGVPQAWCEPYVLSALRALELGVGWLLPPAAFLVDPATDCRILSEARAASRAAATPQKGPTS